MWWLEFSQALKAVMSQRSLYSASRVRSQQVVRGQSDLIEESRQGN